MKNTYNVLFLCNRNSARSIMAESLLNRMGEGHFKAWSAGARPSGVVNPHALQLLRDHDLPTQGLHSKSWRAFETPQAPVFDFIITLCDKVSGEARPDWPGHGVSAHWSIEDPAEVFGDEYLSESALLAFRPHGAARGSCARGLRTAGLTFAVQRVGSGVSHFVSFLRLTFKSVSLGRYN